MVDRVKQKPGFPILVPVPALLTCRASFLISDQFHSFAVPPPTSVLGMIMDHANFLARPAHSQELNGFLGTISPST